MIYNNLLRNRMEQNQKTKFVYWIDDKLYLNITNKCSNKCKFCIKNFKNGIRGFRLESQQEPTSIQIIEELKEVLNTKNWSEAVFCGFGEPTERLDLLIEITRWIKRYYGKPLLFRVNTNGQGYLLNPGKNVIKELKEAGINKVSVSLNASKGEKYANICQPQFDNAYNAVVDFIKKAKNELVVEVTAVAFSDVDTREIAKFAKRLGITFRRREYIPTVY